MVILLTMKKDKKEIRKLALELRDAIVKRKRETKPEREFQKAIDPYVQGIIKRLEEREAEINSKKILDNTVTKL